jgi:2-iminobutanoate/2-iminopropanoate deaminase
MIAVDAKGKVVGEGDIEAQTRQTLQNLKTALEAAGASLEDVVKTTIFLSDLSNYKGMNTVYNEYFGKHPPARSTVRAELVLPSLLVEIYQGRGDKSAVLFLPCIGGLHPLNVLDNLIRLQVKF